MTMCPIPTCMKIGVKNLHHSPSKILGVYLAPKLTFYVSLYLQKMITRVSELGPNQGFVLKGSKPPFWMISKIITAISMRVTKIIK